MLDQQAQSFLSAEGKYASETTYRLSVLEVFNWGPFRGLHRAELDPQGTAIIGPTGSGKTTLVDALMTLLVAQPRYNLASTGGHDSDRTLISYVRGVLGGDGSVDGEEVARPHKTITGICATYDGGKEPLRLAGLLWTEGPSNAADDLRRRWIFCQADDQSLEQWLQKLHDDGIRELMRFGRETAKLRIFESKTAYLAHVRKFFDVGDNAFTLLNRAAGLKQLNSIDEIFRDLVLDDRSAFDRALEVAGEFDNLAGIHTELETARRQQESLTPIAEEHHKLLKANRKFQLLQTLKKTVPQWFAILGREKWSGELDQIIADRDRWCAQLRRDDEEENSCQSRVDALRERYLQVGGSAIGDLERAIEAQTELLTERRKHADEYRRIVALFGLCDELTPEAFSHNCVSAGHKQSELKIAKDRQMESALVVQSQQHEQEKRCIEIAEALSKVRGRPGSNIPPSYQDFRSALAAQLCLSDDALPFLAELVEVRPEECTWRGAIERAIGAERLRILVPEDCLSQALRWVNHRDNRLHVRLQSAQRQEPSVAGFSDGYVCKLNFKTHPLEATARRLLATRDRHCVSSPEALKNIDHGMTIQGLMSGQRGKFEKQDQRRLDEDWITGFDNKDQLQKLASQLESAQEAAQHQKAESQRHRDELNRLDERLTAIAALLRIDFAAIDLSRTSHELEVLKQRRAELLRPSSSASRAKAAYDLESAQLKSVQSQVGKSRAEIAVLDDRRKSAQTELDKATSRIGRELTEEETSLAKKNLGLATDILARDLADHERARERQIDHNLDEQRGRVEEIEQRLVRQMEFARRVDTGALADIGSEIGDISHYLDRLRTLNEEALPEKRRRFLDYLNRSSDQGVTQLLAGIDEEVDAIEQRIRELNNTLLKVDFRSGRYLQLLPRRIKHERLRLLETAIRKVRAAALKDDDGESHFKALRELVEILREAGGNRRVLASRALLDPRYRLQFFVVEVDRQTGNQSPPRTGSQSGSGGEKELMASHILTASLSYALCPAGASRPLYGTVILDEAFSKSSPSAASRIVEALRIFSLHPVFVTPNKEIGLLKRHTRRVICVQRPAKEASLASISWESMEEIARKQ